MNNTLPFKDKTHQLLAENIDRFMRALHIRNANQLRELGLPGTTSGRHLKAEGSPRLSTIVKFARAFGVEPWVMLYPQDTAESLRTEQPPARYFSAEANEVMPLLAQLTASQKAAIMNTMRKLAQENAQHLQELQAAFPRGLPGAQTEKKPEAKHI